MAHANAKARGGTTGRPASRHVVPAIPLTYVRRAKASKQSAQDAQPAINGSSLKIQHNAEPATPETVTTETVKQEDAVQDEVVPEVTEDRPTSEIVHNEPSPPTTASVVAEQVEEDKDSAAVEHHASKEHDPSQSWVPAERSGPTMDAESVPGPAPVVQPPPVVPPSRYTLPPAFQPTGRAINPLANGGPRPGMNGPARLHHPRPSNGSLQFGFGSDRSSPAPPHSAGFGPPPGLPVPHDGMRLFQGHGFTPSGHAFPHMMPYGTEFVPVTGAESWARHQATASGAEPFTFPANNNYGQSTPRSYQGSSSPNHPDESGTFGQFHPHHGPNGLGGLHDDPRHRHQASRSFNGPGPERMDAGPMPHMAHILDEPRGSEPLATYLQSQFQDTAFADCTLELRYGDDRAQPVQMPGHRVILARSPSIRAILQSNSYESSPSGQPSRVILLVSDDQYLRTDAFWMAVQRIYGYPLLQAPPPQPTGDGHLALAGDPDSRFDFALGYAAAGHLLGWPSVVIRGIHIAAHHLSWNTLEKAVDFVLTDLPSRASADRHTQFAYGEPVQILIDAIISFIMTHFPPYFQLDPSVADPESWARVPATTTALSVSTSEESAGHDGKVQLNHAPRSRPTHIKFGDMGESQENGTEGARIPQQERQVRDILSKVLLNLPFAMFKPIFEVAESRFQNARPVLAEREARRLRALDAVVNDKVGEAAEIRQALQSVEPQHNGIWHVLGWQEEMVPYNTEGPSLGRQWQPLGRAASQTMAGVEMARPSYP